MGPHPHASRAVKAAQQERWRCKTRYCLPQSLFGGWVVRQQVTLSSPTTHVSCSGTPTATTWACAGSALHPPHGSGCYQRQRHYKKYPSIALNRAVGSHSQSQDAPSPKTGPGSPWESCHHSVIADLSPSQISVARNCKEQGNKEVAG